MNTKVKGTISILLMSVIFYMMITTKYTRALGDYVLEFMGLKYIFNFFSINDSV